MLESMQCELKILRDSFSVMGTKALAFNDDSESFVYFSDTGGFLGDKFERHLSFEDFCNNAETIAMHENFKGLENIFYSFVRFGGSKFVFFGSPTATHFLEFLLDWWQQPLRFFKNKQLRGSIQPTRRPKSEDSGRSSSAVPKIWFPATVKASEIEAFSELFKAQPTQHPESAIQSAIKGMFTPDDFSLWNPELLDSFFSEGLLPIRLYVDNQRVIIHVLNCTPSELPVSRLSLSRNGNSIECLNRLLVDNKTISGFTIHFPDQQVAETYLLKSGLLDALNQPKMLSQGEGTAKLVGLIGQVRVDGFIGGSRIGKSLFDAQISENNLGIYDRDTGENICSFELASPHLSINGKADEFIISTDYSTVVRITSDSKDFLLAVYQNRAAQDTATRTSHVGPFMATNDEGIIRIAPGEFGATISVNGAEPSEIPSSEENHIADPILSILEEKATVRVDDFELRGGLPELEGIYATLNALTLKRVVAADFEQTVARILGLEGQYLTFCAFGKFAHAQIVIAEALGNDPHGSMSIMSGSKERGSFLAIMNQFAGVLSRDCETILHYFPSFVCERDKVFLTTTGLLNSLDFGKAEAGYQAALRNYGSLSPHLYRIENTVSRFGAFKKAATKPEGWATYAPLGVSVAASLLNPIFLIGAAQQTFSLVSREGSKSTHAADTLNDVFESCAQEWDFVMQTLIPFVSNRFAQDIYPVRLATASILIKAYRDGDATLKAKLIEAVSRRLGRLISFLEFPSGSAPKISRQKCVDFLFETQKHAQGFEERPF